MEMTGISAFLGSFYHSANRPTPTCSTDRAMNQCTRPASGAVRHSSRSVGRSPAGCRRLAWAAPLEPRSWNRAKDCAGSSPNKSYHQRFKHSTRTLFAAIPAHQDASEVRAYPNYPARRLGAPVFPALRRRGELGSAGGKSRAFPGSGGAIFCTTAFPPALNWVCAGPYPVREFFP